MRFAIYALDGTDPDALSRRMAARPAHLERVKALFEAGLFKYGGPLLDEAGNMNGSIAVYEVESEEALKTEILAKEPYATEGVWQTITIYPHKAAPYFE